MTMPCIAYLNHSGTGEKVAIARISGGHYTVEHINATADSLD
ncbi:MAG: Uncharacterised protein [Porticoccaceae bacterium UBA1117]|nr:MAG: Uncharacterised protein [Porticoccaceae bacterium UBA1117]